MSKLVGMTDRNKGCFKDRCHRGVGFGVGRVAKTLEE